MEAEEPHFLPCLPLPCITNAFNGKLYLNMSSIGLLAGIVQAMNNDILTKRGIALSITLECLRITEVVRVLRSQ